MPIPSRRERDLRVLAEVGEEEKEENAAEADAVVAEVVVNSKVDAVGGELQEDPVEEDEMYTPKERKEKKAKKEKRDKAPKEDKGAPKEDVVAKKEQVQQLQVQL